MLHVGVIYDRARIWRAVWECILRIRAEITVCSTVMFITFAFDLVDVVESSTRLRLTVRVANCFAHMFLIDYAFNISILVLFSCFEALLASLAVMTRVWISTEA
jgi:hypothetical protein